MTIHPTAIIADNVIFGKNISIGAYSIIKEGVIIGDNTIIESHCTIEHSKIGQNCYIGSNCIIGFPPQDLHDKGIDTWVEIGNNVSIREFCTIHRGTQKGNGKTIIEDNCLLMVYCHVAHDCHIKQNVILTNNVTLGGHVIINPFAILSAFFLVHQNVEIGEMAFCVALNRTAKSIPPFVMVDSCESNARIMKLNTVGLRRNGLSEEAIKQIGWAYNTIKSKPNKEAFVLIEEKAKDFPELRRIIDFYKNTKVPVLAFSKGEVEE